jgi:hypothetical protein
MWINLWSLSINLWLLPGHLPYFQTANAIPFLKHRSLCLHYLCKDVRFSHHFLLGSHFMVHNWDLFALFLSLSWILFRVVRSGRISRSLILFFVFVTFVALTLHHHQIWDWARFLHLDWLLHWILLFWILDDFTVCWRVFSLLALTVPRPKIFKTIESLLATRSFTPSWTSTPTTSLIIRVWCFLRSTTRVILLLTAILAIPVVQIEGILFVSESLELRFRLE